jgi:hypothetical protein
VGGYKMHRIPGPDKGARSNPCRAGLLQDDSRGQGPRAKTFCKKASASANLAVGTLPTIGRFPVARDGILTFCGPAGSRGSNAAVSACSVFCFVGAEGGALDGAGAGKAVTCTAAPTCCSTWSNAAKMPGELGTPVAGGEPARHAQPTREWSASAVLLWPAPGEPRKIDTV